MIEVRAGRSFDAVLEGAPTGLVGTLGIRVVDPTTQATPVARTTTGIHEYPAGSGVYGATLTAPALGANVSPWALSILWDTGEPLDPDGVFTEDLTVFSGLVPNAPSAAFATADDVATRLGRALGTEEALAVEMLCEAATVLIADAAGHDADWAANLDPVPPILRFLCVELVLRAMANPQGVASSSEQLGAYAISQRFRDDGGGLLLTKLEELLVRRTVRGRTSGSVQLPSIVTDLIDDGLVCTADGFAGS